MKQHEAIHISAFVPCAENKTQRRQCQWHEAPSNAEKCCKARTGCQDFGAIAELFLIILATETARQFNSFTKRLCENKSSGSATLLVQGAIDETCRLRRASLGKNLECLLSHEVAHLLGLCLVFLRDVVPAGIGGVVLAVGGQAT